MTLMLLVGLAEGLTAGGSTRRGKPLPLPLMVGSTQSYIGTVGPVYGYRSSTTGTAWTEVNASATSAEIAFRVMVGDNVDVCNLFI